MSFVIEYIIITLAFWFVSTRMEGIEMKKTSTVLPAAFIYLISFAIGKAILIFTFNFLTFGLMLGVHIISSIFAAILAMYMVTQVVDDYKIDSFGVLTAAVFVISIVSVLLRIVFYMFL